MTISGGVWHTYDVTWQKHKIPRLGLKHPRGCVQQVNTSLVFNYLMMTLSHSSQKLSQVDMFQIMLPKKTETTSQVTFVIVIVGWSMGEFVLGLQEESTYL